MVPDRAACLGLLQDEGVPEHIVAHSVRVAQVAVRIGEALNREAGEKLDLALLEAGALLHDISKLHTIHHGGDHATVGAQRVGELGCEELAPLVQRHVDIGPWSPDGPVTEAELVNYADKRVRHEELVSLEDRFTDLLERYGTTDRARERIHSFWRAMSEMEIKIFRRLSFGPDLI
jgi:putative nucleotidyltransferase with HDIG domain